MLTKDFLENLQIYNSSDPVDSQREKIMSVEFTAVILVAYSVLCVISVFGNALVCYVISKNKRLHTATNIFIANLAVSDLLVTFINVPFNIARNLLDDWPFGEAPCHLVNFSLVLTCYVSTYTLTSIALDRHRVVLKPMSRRMTRKFAISILVLIWVVAIFLSLPYGTYMRVLKVNFLVTKMYRRCRFIAPDPKEEFEQFLTVTTFILQYCVPFALIAIAYGRIVQSLWARTHVGAVTANQQMSQYRAKKKSIKLLIAVVIVFAICWLPLNMYHLLTDLYPHPEMFQYNSKAFFACHWIAISSTCYNPFVYCWLNENFRQEVKDRFACIFGLPCWTHSRLMSRATLMEVKSLKDTTRAGSGTQSSTHVSLRRDPTTTTDVCKIPSQHGKRTANGTAGGLFVSLRDGLGDDEEEVPTDCTEEAAHSLIIVMDCNGQEVVMYKNGSVPE